MTEIPWTPLPGPQSLAYHSPADELFYGGAAGGGKTDLLLGLAGTAAHRAVLFRREYEQLKAVIERSKEVFGGTGTYNINSKTWRLPGGRSLEFGAMKDDDDKRNWQGRPHDHKLWDEITNILESQYRFANGWLRTTRPQQRCRVVCAGNPPTDTQGEWVLRRWAAWLDPQHPHPAGAGELRWYATVAGEEVEREDGAPFEWHGDVITPKSRTFIPARLSDNPFLLATDYGATLQALPEPLRSQMLYGDFRAGMASDPYQIIPRAWVEAAQARWRAQDGPPGPMEAMGVDVARGGQDQTVLAPRHGTWFAPLRTYPGVQTPDGQSVATLVLAAKPGAAQVNVDVIGVGGSAYDHLSNRCDARAINVGSKSTARDKSGKLGFVNLRAQLWWQFREALDPLTGQDLALPPDAELLADLCAPRWSVQAGGIKVESKDELRKRLGRSPDKGDAVILGTAEVDGPVQHGGYPF